MFKRRDVETEVVLPPNVYYLTTPPSGISLSTFTKDVNMAGDVHINMYRTIINFFVVISYLILSVCCSEEASKSLYSDKDDVFILDHTNFKKNVIGSDTAWFVEFYSSWCGHCVRFAPTWKKLAADVKGKFVMG